MEGTEGEMHPQASFTYKERELGWLCGHSSREGFCTQSHSWDCTRQARNKDQKLPERAVRVRSAHGEGGIPSLA